ncbi:hypothetical protein bcgnr5372_38540 [Bacillus luti]|nr:hypothetical protein [Bacillus cereus]HDR8327236.1 hypothetical protein [Bacillus cereus]HDR8336426.1 hypothetical protein [Bacillus cereus]
MKKAVAATTGLIIGGLVIAGLAFQSDSDYSWGTEGNSSSNGWPQEQTPDYSKALQQSKETTIIQNINNECCECSKPKEDSHKMWEQYYTGKKPDSQEAMDLWNK